MNRLPRDLEKSRDRARLLREWKAWHAEQLDAALAGEHGALIAALVKLLDRLDLRAAAVLVDIASGATGAPFATTCASRRCTSSTKPSCACASATACRR